MRWTIFTVHPHFGKNAEIKCRNWNILLVNLCDTPPQRMGCFR
jgi:hypothetical protein